MSKFFTKPNASFSYVAVVAASLAAAALLVAQPAFAQAAAQQKLNPAQSEVGFQFKQMGVPVDGKFTKFDAQVSFDAAKLATSKVNFTVDIASATLGDKATDAELPKATWFNTAKFPQATFASSSIKSLGAGKFEVAGKLSIKGVAQDVVVPVTMTQAAVPGGGAAAVTTAIGTFPMKRLTYKIGEGEWADTSMVADPVQVKFKLALTGIGKL
jgi:polyisoprenoid-binding protein YceI